MTRLKVILYILGFGILVLVQMSYKNVSANALSSEGTCSDIEAVFARGSGNGKPSDSASTKFRSSVTSLLQDKTITYGQYDLGTEEYGGAKYPYAEITFSTGLGAALSGGENFKYGKSVDAGVTELQAYLAARVKKCPDASYVLAGYSQGAQVIGDALPDIPKDIRKKVSYVALFADPKLNLPEGNEYTVYDNFINSNGNPFAESGELIDKIPDACYGVNLSAWRHTIDNCEYTRTGSLGARSPYAPDDIAGRTHLWCIDHDIVCGSTPASSRDNSGHESHYVEDRAIPTATREVLEAVANRKPALKPIISVDMDIRKHTLTQKTKYDVAILSNGYCFAGDLPGDVDIYSKIYNDAKQPGNIFVGYGNFFEGETDYNYSPDAAVPLVDPFYPIKEWRTDTQKIIYVFSEPWCRIRYDNIDKLVRYDLVSVAPSQPSVVSSQQSKVFAANRTEDITNSPIIVLLTTPETNADMRAQTQNYNNYYVIPYSYEDQNINDIPSLANITLQNLYFPKFTTNEYKALVSQPITFSLLPASVSSNISQFAWDFNDDGITDQSTTSPTVTHAYSAPYTGVVRVRTTDADGATGVASTNVSAVSQITRRSPIATPSKVTIRKLSDTSASVEWVATDEGVDSWLVKIGGFPIGRVDKISRSTTIEDLLFDEPLTISISGVNTSGIEGEPTSATIDPNNLSETTGLTRSGSGNVNTLISKQDSDHYKRLKQETLVIDQAGQTSALLGEHTERSSGAPNTSNRFQLSLPILVTALCAGLVIVMAAAYVILYKIRKS